MIRDIRHSENQIDISFQCPTLSIPIMQPIRFQYMDEGSESRREHGYMLRSVAANVARMVESEILAIFKQQGHLV